MKAGVLIILAMMISGCKEGPGRSPQALHTEHVLLTEGTRLDNYVQALTDMGKFNGVVYAEKNDQVLLHQAYNTEVYHAPTLKIGKESQFDLRSVAKLFAKASLIAMEEEGTLKLSDPVGRHIKGCPWGEKITLKQLMDHTSGLPRELSHEHEPAITLNPEEVIGLIRNETLEFQPGTDTLYSNPGYQLLYYIIGEKSASSLAKVLRERFFEKVPMKHSGSHFYDEEGILNDYAYGHYLKNDTLVAIRELEEEDMRMGHLFSTAADMAKFLDYLSESELSTRMAKDGIITHAGGTRGKRAWVYADLAKGYRIVFLSNIDMIPFERLTNDLVSIMNGEAVKIPTPVHREGTTIRKDLLKTYAGTYDFVEAGHLILEFRVEKDSLAVYQNGKFGGMLMPENDSVFFADAKSEESVLFRKDDDGAMKAFMDFQGVRWEGIRMKETGEKSNKE